MIEDLDTVRQMSDEKMAEILASLAASTAWKHELPFAAEFFREVNRRLSGRADLLEALKEAVEVFDGINDDEINTELLPKLRAALTKAGAP